MAWATENAERAAQLLGAAEALRETIGMQMWPIDQVEHDRIVAEVRACLPDAQLASAWREGRRGKANEELITSFQGGGPFPLLRPPLSGVSQIAGTALDR